MVRRTKEEAEQTRDSLLAVAEQLFLEKGVAKTSLANIAKAAGVTRGAIYWHFADKDALFTAMHEQVKLPFDLLMEEAIAKDDPVEGLRVATIKSLQNIVSDNRARSVFTILVFRCEQNTANVPRDQQCRTGVIDKLEKVITKIHKQGKLTPTMNPQEAAHFLHCFMVGIFSDYVRNPKEYDLMKLAPVFVETIFMGLFRG